MDYDYNVFFFPGVVDIPDGLFVPCFCFHLIWYLSPFGLRKEQQTAKHEKSFKRTAMNLAILGLSIVREGGCPTSSPRIDPKSPTFSTFGGSIFRELESPNWNPPNHWGLSDAFGDQAPRSERRSLQCLPPWLLLGQWRMQGREEWFTLMIVGGEKWLVTIRIVAGSWVIYPPWNQQIAPENQRL